MSRRRRRSLVSAGVLLSLACANRPPQVNAVVTIAPADTASGEACVSFAALTGSVAQPKALCLSRDRAGRRAARADLTLGDSVRCVRIANPANRIGFVDASDRPDRDLLELEPVAQRVAFLVQLDDPGEFQKWLDEGNQAAAKPGGLSGAGGMSGAGGASPRAASGSGGVASPVFGSFIATLGSELEIDVFSEACASICPQRVGEVSASLSRSGGIRARVNAQQEPCRVVGPLAFDSHAAGRAGSASGGRAAGAESVASGAGGRAGSPDSAAGASSDPGGAGGKASGGAAGLAGAGGAAERARGGSGGRRGHGR